MNMISSQNVYNFCFEVSFSFVKKHIEDDYGDFLDVTDSLKIPPHKHDDKSQL